MVFLLIKKQNKMENILVAGATGTTGGKVVNLLKSSQYFEPIAMVRKKEQQSQFESRGIKTVLADLEEDVSQAFNDIDKVIFAAGSGGKKVKEVDQDGAKKMVDASEKNNVKKFVMLSSMGADQPEAVEDLQEYLEAKQNADNHLRDSSLKYTIVRPGTLNDDKAKDHIKISEKLNEKGEISRADVAQVLVKSLHDDAPSYITFEILEGETLIAKALEKIEH